MSLVHVAVGVIRRSSAQGPEVLVARRPEHLHQGGLLEFPGGKVEPGEDVRQALRRELVEETGLDIDPNGLRPLISIRHDYGDKHVFLDVWETESFTGTPKGLEGQPVFWKPVSSLSDDEFPAANQAIIHAIRLPDFVLVTGPAATTPSSHALRRRLTGWRGNLCVVRAPELSAADYGAQFERLAVDCQASGVAPLVHGDPSRCLACPQAAGLHMPWAVAEALDERPIETQYWLGVSCHDERELAHAHRIGADYAFLSPVAPTPSHPRRGDLGWDRFAELVRDAALPVYAMGGLSDNDWSNARCAGGQGVAGIGFWWNPQGPGNTIQG